MNTLSITVIIILVGALCVFLFIAKRAMRWAIRLALLGIVVLALLVGSLAWWWYGSGEPAAPGKANRPATPAPRRANSR